MPFLEAKSVLLDRAFRHDQPAQPHNSDVQTHGQSGNWSGWIGRSWNREVLFLSTHQEQATEAETVEEAVANLPF